MPNKERRKYTKEQKADAVRLARESGNMSQTGRDLGIANSMIQRWVRQADIDEGHGPEEAMTSDETEEIRALRRENRTLKMERDFLKKAAAFFAKEQDRPSS